VSSPTAFRIVSYNVRYFSHALRGLASTRGTRRRIAAAISALGHGADVLCLQEVETISLRSRLADRRGQANHTQLEAFMADLEECAAEAEQPCPWDAFYFRAHRYGGTRMPIYTTGLAVLVDTRRLLVTGHNQESPHPITHHHVVRFRDRKQTRICAHLKLRTGDGRSLHVFNTHLSLPTPFTRTFWTAREKMGYGPNQLEEARSLAEFIERRTGGEPFVVCGDFNSPPGSPVYRALTGTGLLQGAQESLGLIDASAPRGFPTAGVARLRMHLDHVFASPAIRFLDMEGTHVYGDARSPFHGLSDHVPLIARFRF
jgi:endonuclease/exonuclease/phosphatase family metal-dependent hydrolase